VASHPPPSRCSSWLLSELGSCCSRFRNWGSNVSGQAPDPLSPRIRSCTPLGGPLELGNIGIAVPPDRMTGNDCSFQPESHNWTLNETCESRASLSSYPAQSGACVLSDVLGKDFENEDILLEGPFCFNMYDDVDGAGETDCSNRGGQYFDGLSCADELPDNVPALPPAGHGVLIFLLLGGALVALKF
jgi:hypothetical protein